MAGKVKSWVVNALIEQVNNGELTVDGIKDEAARKAVAKRLAAKPEPETTLAKWAHPATGEVRIYVNDRVLGRGCKLFFYNDNGFANYKISGDITIQAKQLADSIGQKYFGDWSSMIAVAK
jgi:hypothetical protein